MFVFFFCVLNFFIFFAGGHFIRGSPRGEKRCAPAEFRQRRSLEWRSSEGWSLKSSVGIIIHIYIYTYLHIHYVTLRYITLHSITLQYIHTYTHTCI